MLNFVLILFLSQLTVGMEQVCLVRNTLADGFFILIRHSFFFLVKNQLANPLQTPQQKYHSLPHLIAAVHFFYKSEVAYQIAYEVTVMSNLLPYLPKELEGWIILL